MSDVGRMAGVSAQTVSRFFTGTGYVSEDTRSRIQHAIDTLGYRPNRIARNLHVARTDTIGVLTVGDFNYGSAQTLTGMSAGAQEADVSLITAHLELSEKLRPRQVQVAIERMISMRVDGIIVSARIEGLEGILIETVRDEVPVVVIAGRPDTSVDSIVADSYTAGSLVMSHLLELGHRSIVYLAGPVDSDESRERERAYHRSMSHAGIPALPIVAGGDWTSIAGYNAGLGANFESFTAVFAGNDELALGFMAAARERGLSIPEDFSIAGVDDMPEARFFAPALTTARLDFLTLGRKAFEMIRRRVETGESQERLLIAPQLVVRRSTAIRNVDPSIE
jgi:DNA-binding LacI/PurR family transcriptional regulator